jgi:hypothetical protein
MAEGKRTKKLLRNYQEEIFAFCRPGKVDEIAKQTLPE